ncbi:MAG: hypothetical protein FWG64_08355 [Firmicutes bacterium]|nr:hypothetical protein [Bacillota bacterium]
MVGDLLEFIIHLLSSTEIVALILTLLSNIVVFFSIIEGFLKRKGLKLDNKLKEQQFELKIEGLKLDNDLKKNSLNGINYN